MLCIQNTKSECKPLILSVSLLPSLMSPTLSCSPALMTRPHAITVGQVTSLGGGGHDFRGGLMGDASPQQYLKRWGKISQVEMKGKIFQRERTFLCKVKSSAKVQGMGSRVRKMSFKSNSGINCFSSWPPVLLSPVSG